MEIFEALKGRRSCRDFLPDAIPEGDLERILEAGTWAPSPLNMQPWRFYVITGQGLKDRIAKECERCRAWALEKSGWKWLERYSMSFVKSVPAIVAVCGDPSKSGVDTFMEGGPQGYQHACAAAIQNMCLAAHALGLGSLWFTFFDRKNMASIIGTGKEEIPLALLLLGKPAGPLREIPRKSYKEKVVYLK